VILLDTDICIELLRGNRTVLEKNQDSKEDSYISFMTVGELLYGAEKSTNPESNKKKCQAFFRSVSIIYPTISTMEIFAQIKGDLSGRSLLLPDADLLIAATCLQQKSRLVTGNVKHFERFDNLKIENWLR